MVTHNNNNNVKEAVSSSSFAGLVPENSVKIISGITSTDQEELFKLPPKIKKEDFKNNFLKNLPESSIKLCKKVSIDKYCFD